ncbi:hypothetical protein EC968_010228 [Mortierella alpina]|nr:hypothetical protein EC968_010228 [Mortierella alpina]
MREAREAFVYVAENEKVHKSLMDDNESIRTRLERTLIHTEKAITAKSMIRPGMNLMKASPIPEFLEKDPTITQSNRAAGERSRVGGGNPEGDPDPDIIEIDTIAPATASSTGGSLVDAGADAESISGPNEEHVLQESILEPRENYPIPRIFNLSMLQASVSDFPVRIEDMLRQFGKDRMRHFEFAAAGELSRHMYRFPQQESIIAKRKRVHDGLDKVQRRSLKRKLKTVLRRFSHKRKKSLEDNRKGKDVDGEVQGQTGETEGGEQIPGESIQGHSSDEGAQAGAVVAQSQSPRDIA